MSWGWLALVLLAGWGWPSWPQGRSGSLHPPRPGRQGMRRTQAGDLLASLEVLPCFAALPYRACGAPCITVFVMHAGDRGVHEFA